MEKQPKEEIIESHGLRSQIEKKSSQQMKDSDHDLSWKEAVRDHSHDKRRHHGRNARRGVGKSNRREESPKGPVTRPFNICKELPHGNIPNPPNKKLEEHHYTKADGER